MRDKKESGWWLGTLSCTVHHARDRMTLHNARFERFPGRTVWNGRGQIGKR